MTSPADLCSKALNLLGAKSIVSLDEGTDRARTCNAAYSLLIETLLSMHTWSFATEPKKLTRSADAPARGWTYKFLLPSGRIDNGAIAAYNSDAVDAPPIQNFQIYGNFLYANDAEIWIDYTYKPDESYFPPYFKELIVDALCARIAYSITDQQNVVDHWQRIAFGLPSDGGRGGKFLLATQLDDRGKIAKSIQSYEILEARNG